MMVSDTNPLDVGIDSFILADGADAVVPPNVVNPPVIEDLFLC